MRTLVPRGNGTGVFGVSGAADIAVAAARELHRTPRTMLEASWQDRVDVYRLAAALVRVSLDSKLAKSVRAA